MKVKTSVKGGLLISTGPHVRCGSGGIQMPIQCPPNG